MAREIREFAVLVPANTPKAAPVTVNISFPAREVVAVSWRVPPGPSGLMGWQLTSAGTPVIPIQPNTYMVTDNQADTWPLEGYLDSGNWQVTAYNAGIYPHTVYFTFQLDLPGAPAPSPVPLAGTAVSVVGTGGTVTTAPPSSGVPPAAMPPTTGPADPVVSAVIAVIIARHKQAGG